MPNLSISAFREEISTLTEEEILSDFFDFFVLLLCFFIRFLAGNRLSLHLLKMEKLPVRAFCSFSGVPDSRVNLKIK